MLPGYDPAYSGYRFTLEVERLGLSRSGRRTPEISTQVLVSSQANIDVEPTKPTAIPRPDYTLVTEGQLTKSSPVRRGHYEPDHVGGIQSATLTMTYWPDRSDESGSAQVALTEVQ
ncbi:hypothetical protein WS48_16195 [Burkholderia sp. RF7-non_BP1]|nr:hypothetical protein WS49_25715 [Burkholderia sp. RF7-non_BP4]KUY96476.1 hypothetical protein WS48_16195 [Burkholderia sp. RF7-non_BP1]